jgi:hypothetical protein
MRIIFTALFFMISLVVFSQSNTPGITYGGSKYDGGTSLLLRDDGAYVVCGNTKSFGTGSKNMFILIIRKDGQIVSSKIYGRTHQSNLMSIIPVENGYAFGGYVWDGGMARHDIYFLKTDLLGNKLIEGQYGTHEVEKGFNICKADNNNFLLLGYSRGFTDHKGDIMVVRVDDEGNELWRNGYGTAYDDYAFDLTGNDTDGYYIIGSAGGFYKDVHANFKNHDADLLLIKIDKDGNTLWQKQYGETGHDFGYALLKEEHSLYLVGSSQSYGNGDFDLLLIKTDTAGQEIWHKNYGGDDYEYGYSLAKSVDNHLYLFGTSKSYGTENTPDYYLVKTDTLGNEVWSLTIGNTGEDYGYKVIATPDSGCAVVGQSSSYGAGDFDMLFVKVSKNGIIQNIVNDIDTLEKTGIVVAPNPAKDHIKFIYNYSENPGQYLVRFYSVKGDLIEELPLENSFANYPISFSSGLYIYRVVDKKTDQIVTLGKLIVQ